MQYIVYAGRFDTLKELYTWMDNPYNKKQGEIHKVTQNEDNSFNLFIKVHDPYDDDHCACCGCCEHMSCEMGTCWCDKIRTSENWMTECAKASNDFGRTCKEFRLEL